MRLPHKEYQVGSTPAITTKSHLSGCNVSLVDGPPWKWEDAGSNPASQTNEIFNTALVLLGRPRVLQTLETGSIPVRSTRIYGKAASRVSFRT